MAEIRGVIKVRRGLVFVLLLAITVSGCRTSPDSAGVPRLDGAPATGSEVTTDDILLTVDPRSVDPARVDHIRIEVYPSGREVKDPVAEYRVTPSLPSLSFSLPLRGLEDGVEYRFVFFLILDGGSEQRLLEDLVLRLRFGLGAPEVTVTPIQTFDPRPELSWSLPIETVAAGIVVEISTEGAEPVHFETEAPEFQGTVRPQQNVVSAAEISAGTEHIWRMRLMTAAGVLGPWSLPGTIVFTDTIDPPAAVTGHGDMPSIVTEPGLVWNSLTGARYYQIEAGVVNRSVSSGSSVQAPIPTSTLSLEATESRVRLTIGNVAELLEAVEVDTGQVLNWRVRAENGIGNRTAWSDWFRFVYQPLLPTMQPVLSLDEVSNATNAVVLGVDPTVSSVAEPDPDETPPLVVPLAIPYAMSRFEITAEAVAAVFNAAIAGGRAVITPDESGEQFVIDPVTELPLLGLGNLDFGRQFTIVLDETTLAPAPGYRSHPAVGVSWYGAVALANELSLLEARDAVYEIGPTGGVTAYPERDGYRLPTEAEWAFAASLPHGSEAQQPMQLIREDRPVGASEVRGINYQRSGDRWEDVTPPFTRNGGPTSPVGAAGHMNGIGIADLLGNVWEWTADWYDPNWYTRAATAERPTNGLFRGPDQPVPDVYGRELKVLRGSAWNTPIGAVRPSSRGTFSPSSTSHSIGVRLVRSVGRTPVPASRNN